MTTEIDLDDAMRDHQTSEYEILKDKKTDHLRTLGTVVAEMMNPIISAMGKMIENNTAALDRLCAAQTIQNDRLEALEKQIRLQTPVNSKQVGYLNGAILDRARELLDKKDISDKKAINKLRGYIRKAVLSRYGIGSIREIPKYDYSTAMEQIKIWSDVMTVRDVAKGVRKE